MDHNSDTDRLREIFSVRFELLAFLNAALRFKTSPIIAWQSMDPARRLHSLEPEFWFSLLAMQGHRRRDLLGSRWRQKI
jgi:hypothetical protein